MIYDEVNLRILFHKDSPCASILQNFLKQYSSPWPIELNANKFQAFCAHLLTFDSSKSVKPYLIYGYGFVRLCQLRASQQFSTENLQIEIWQFEKIKNYLAYLTQHPQGNHLFKIQVTLKSLASLAHNQAIEAVYDAFTKFPAFQCVPTNRDLDTEINRYKQKLAKAKRTQQVEKMRGHSENSLDRLSTSSNSSTSTTTSNALLQQSLDTIASDYQSSDQSSFAVDHAGSTHPTFLPLQQMRQQNPHPNTLTIFPSPRDPLTTTQPAATESDMLLEKPDQGCDCCFRLWRL